MFRVRNIVFICAILSFLLYFSSGITFGQESKEGSIQNISKTKDVGNIDEEELSEEESDITTKIYKSTDPASKLLDNKSIIKNSLESDILNKEELLHKSKKHKSKVHERSKKDYEYEKIHKNNLFLPWLVLFGTCIVLGIIFKLLKQKKL